MASCGRSSATRHRERERGTRSFRMCEAVLGARIVLHAAHAIARCACRKLSAGRRRGLNADRLGVCARNEREERPLESRRLRAGRDAPHRRGHLRRLEASEARGLGRPCRRLLSPADSEAATHEVPGLLVDLRSAEARSERRVEATLRFLTISSSTRPRFAGAPPPPPRPPPPRRARRDEALRLRGGDARLSRQAPRARASFRAGRAPRWPRGACRLARCASGASRLRFCPRRRSRVRAARAESSSSGFACARAPDVASSSRGSSPSRPSRPASRPGTGRDVVAAPKDAGGSARAARGVQLPPRLIGLRGPARSRPRRSRRQRRRRTVPAPVDRVPPSSAPSPRRASGDRPRPPGASIGGSPPAAPPSSDVLDARAPPPASPQRPLGARASRQLDVPRRDEIARGRRRPRHGRRLVDRREAAERRSAPTRCEPPRFAAPRATNPSRVEKRAEPPRRRRRRLALARCPSAAASTQPARRLFAPPVLAARRGVGARVGAGRATARRLQVMVRQRSAVASGRAVAGSNAPRAAARHLLGTGAARRPGACRLAVVPFARPRPTRCARRRRLAAVRSRGDVTARTTATSPPRRRRRPSLGKTPRRGGKPSRGLAERVDSAPAPRPTPARAPARPAS